MCHFQIILKSVIEPDTNFKHPCAFDDISPALEGLSYKHTVISKDLTMRLAVSSMVHVTHT